jgi:hypothetical protein
MVWENANQSQNSKRLNDCGSETIILCWHIIVKIFSMIAPILPERLQTVHVKETQRIFPLTC